MNCTLEIYFIIFIYLRKNCPITVLKSNTKPEWDNVVYRLFRLLVILCGSQSSNPSAAAGTDPCAQPRRQMSIPGADYKHLPTLVGFKLTTPSSKWKYSPSENMTLRCNLDSLCPSVHLWPLFFLNQLIYTCKLQTCPFAQNASLSRIQDCNFKIAL